MGRLRLLVSGSKRNSQIWEKHQGVYVRVKLRKYVDLNAEKEKKWLRSSNSYAYVARSWLMKER